MLQYKNEFLLNPLKHRWNPNQCKRQRGKAERRDKGKKKDRNMRPLSIVKPGLA